MNHDGATLLLSHQAAVLQKLWYTIMAVGRLSLDSQVSHTAYIMTIGVTPHALQLQLPFAHGEPLDSVGLRGATMLVALLLPCKVL